MNMKYWIHATTGGPFNALANSIDTKGKTKWPNNLQSITYNIAGTEAIVKVEVEGTDEEWLLANVPSHNKVIRLYTEADHDEIFLFLYTPEWTEAV